MAIRNCRKALIGQPRAPTNDQMRTQRDPAIKRAGSELVRLDELRPAGGRLRKADLMLTYSDSPAASRASSRRGNVWQRTALPSRIAQRCPTRFSMTASLPEGRALKRTKTTI